MAAGELTEKQEAFTLVYFETGNAAEAYRQAYDVSENAKDNWIYVEASQLLDNPKVSLRLKVLQEQAAALSFYTVQKAAEEYEAARELAMKEKNPSGAVSAISGKVKLFGMERPAKWRHEHTGKDGAPIQTEEVGQGAAKIAAALDAINSRTTSDTSAE